MGRRTSGPGIDTGATQIDRRPRETGRAHAEQMSAVYSRSELVPLRISAFVAELKAFLDVWPGCLAPSAR